MKAVLSKSDKRSPFWIGLRAQLRVLGALVMREMITRYGRENIGFLWLILEPMILTCGVMLLWTLMRHEAHGLTVIAFVLSGYMPLTLWRHISSHMVSCLKHNIPLMYHRQIKLADALIARALLEIGGTTFALLVVYTGAVLAGFIEPFADLGLILAGWLFMAWFSFGAGLILAGLAEIFEVVEKLVPPLQYLMLPVSGMFFMVAWLPHDVQKLALYVPTVHCFEMFRAGTFGDAVKPFYDVSYIFTSCLLTTAVGLYLIEHVKSHIKFE
ncbi:ABC transporter permease (plasmid) [Phyllobacterium sp. 628]|uniref:ABC transporter permease n=1 Tax=Phyllobacterium sp. 628 TaxID=2718938 RepID=UPI00166220CC|nr:ABC transporter permease [Phyllobacterium sp. 628]QND50591.1 ABC transporter permease [Phyllobacterium sp. 628]